MHFTYCSSGVTSRLPLGGVSIRFLWLAVAAITHLLAVAHKQVCDGGRTPKSLVVGPLREIR